MEAIGPLSCTKDGMYIAGGAPSGNAYLWEVWDLISGRLLQTQVYPTSITAITLHPVEQLLFSGSADGKIFVNLLDLGPVEVPLVSTEDQAFVLKGHK